MVTPRIGKRKPTTARHLSISQTIRIIPGFSTDTMPAASYSAFWYERAPPFGRFQVCFIFRNPITGNRNCLEEMPNPEMLPETEISFCQRSVIYWQCKNIRLSASELRLCRAEIIFVAVVGVFVLTFKHINNPFSRMLDSCRACINPGDFNPMETKNEGQQILIR